MQYLNAFLCGGILCVIGQIFIDKTKLTPARILVSYVMIGVLLSGIGIYKPFSDFAGAGANIQHSHALASVNSLDADLTCLVLNEEVTRIKARKSGRIAAIES